MDTKVLNRAFGILSFALALVVYLLTVQPSVPFWDCGEFTSAAIWQQVPHPPGSPLFLMIGKLFHLIIPFGDPAWRVNLVSVFSSAFTIWLLYLIIVKVIENFRSSKAETFGEAIAVYGSAFIGAAAFTFSDTFWFNAVESEVYAASSLFVAIMVYLMMRWNEEADNPGHERYLLLMAYLIGLSTGVHLLAVLCVFSIVMLVYFRKYTVNFKSFMIMGIIAVVIFFIIYPGVVKWIPALLAGHSPMKNAARDYVIDNSPIMILLAIGTIVAAGFGLWWGAKNQKRLLNLACSSFLLIILGYTTYTQVLIRANSNPPMNENEPNQFSELAAYLGREQYGEAPSWPRRYQNDDYYIQNYEKRDDKGEYVYGKWIPPTRVEAQRNDGSWVLVPEFRKSNFTGELNYLLKYQIRHMYMRYFFWNFVGRKSDIQDSEEAWFTAKDAEQINYESGFAKHFPVRFFALPLIFGLVGLFFHFYRDPKMALVYLTMFLLMGVLTAIAQNQQEPQPRERDYFYAGSFMIWCLWIGLGVYYLIERAVKEKISPAIASGIVIGSLILVPVNMAVGGWAIHSRAGNYIPFDYSYNILQSSEQDAIIFTNGDNDTFPVWYLQDVAGVRRDVRIVNLSLGNTLWYIDQLKNREPWGAKKIPLSFSDDSLRVTESDPRALSYDFGEAQQIAIPVSQDILKQYTDDPAILADGNFRFVWMGKNYTERDGKTIYLFRVQDKLILDILQQVRFTRPVYFSTTVGPDAFAGLEKFFRYEGMCMRICPVPQKTGATEPIHTEIMKACLLNVDNSNEYHTEPNYGFKLRNLNNPSIYYDEVHRRLMRTYRHLYLSFAGHLLEVENDKALAMKTLDVVSENISREMFPMTFDQYYRMAKLYADAGNKEKANLYADWGIRNCMELIDNPNLKPEYSYYEAIGRSWGPYRVAAQLYEMKQDFRAAREVMQRLYSMTESIRAKYGNNAMYQEEMQRIANNMLDILVNIDEYKIEEVLQKGSAQAALDTARKIYDGYQASDNPTLKWMARYIERKIKELEGKISGKSSDSAGESQISDMMLLE